MGEHLRSVQATLGQEERSGRRAANPEKVKRLRDREKISREAREESTKTGEPVKAIRKRWGLE